jgi:hypothetical protein
MNGVRLTFLYFQDEATYEMTNRGIRAVEFPSQISPNAAELIRLLCHPGSNLGQPVSF